MYLLTYLLTYLHPVINWLQCLWNWKWTITFVETLMPHFISMMARGVNLSEKIKLLAYSTVAHRTTLCLWCILVPLKSIDVQLTVRGFVGNVVTTLLYKNTEQNLIEAVFEFPIDDQSAVYQFEAKIEDRVIIAECQEKKQVVYCLLCLLSLS